MVCSHVLLFSHTFPGGFAYVYVVQDTQTGNEFALKRLLGSDKQACNTIIRELNLHKQLSGHPNIVQFVAASFIDRTTSGKGNAEYLLVSELCKGEFLHMATGNSATKTCNIPMKQVVLLSTVWVHPWIQKKY